MNTPDPLDVFGLLDPFDNDTFSERDEARLLRIIETPTVRRRPPRGWKRPWLIATVAGVTMATAAFAILHQQRASNPTLLVCYRSPDINGDRAALPSAVDPVAACAAPWMDGTFSIDGPPRMFACVNNSGVAVVFPGDETVCSRLGLPMLQPDRNGDLQAIVDLEQRLAETFRANCYHQADALAKAQKILDETFLTGWRVQLAEDFPSGLECGTPGLLTDSKTVLVAGGRPENP
jgi:hypothetical protein